MWEEEEVEEEEEYFSIMDVISFCPLKRFYYVDVISFCPLKRDCSTRNA
jgi:hypothetical protein